MIRRYTQGQRRFAEMIWRPAFPRRSAVGALLGTWLVLGWGLLGCSGGTPQDTGEAPDASRAVATTGGMGIEEDRLAEVHFREVWKSTVHRSSTIEQAWSDGGNVYITIPGSQGYKLIKIDGETGLDDWSYDLKGKLEFPPHVYRYPKELRDSHPDECFIVQNDVIYCLDDLHGVANYTINCRFPVSTRITASEKFIFVGSWNKRMYCFSKEKKGEQWSFITDAPITAPAEVGELNVFFGSEDNQVYCLNIGAGFQYGKSWRKATSGKVVIAPYFDGGKVFAGSWDYKVYSLEVYQGFERWSYPTGAPVEGRFVSFSDYLFATAVRDEGGVKSHKLIALDRSNGNLKWEAKGVERVVAVDQFHCYALQEDQQIAALRLQTGEQSWVLDTRGFEHVMTQDAERGARRDLWGRVFLAGRNGVVQCIQARR